MTSWECEKCGEKLTEEKLEETIQKGLPEGDELSEKTDISEASKVVLVDCRNCDEELATYKKDNTDSGKESNTKARSKMLQTARK